MHVALFIYSQQDTVENAKLVEVDNSIPYAKLVYHNLGYVIATILLGISAFVIIEANSHIRKYAKTSGTKEFGDSIWSNFYLSLTDALPIEKEEDVQLNHAYDGIRELDNKLPPWWLYMFYVCILWAGVYMWYYHVSDKGLNQLAEYNAEMEVGKALQAEKFAKAEETINENSVVALTGNDIEQGKLRYNNFCSACHLANGGGSVGPNLTDPYWIHGGGIKNIFKTIKYGVPEKGMIAWSKQLRPKEIQQVASFVLSLQGTNPPNAKSPQGDKYDESAQATPATKDTIKTKG